MNLNSPNKPSMRIMFSEEIAVFQTHFRKELRWRKKEALRDPQPERNFTGANRLAGKYPITQLARPRRAVDNLKRISCQSKSG